jgi:hypothetical protein
MRGRCKRSRVRLPSRGTARGGGRPAGKAVARLAEFPTLTASPPPGDPSARRQSGRRGVGALHERFGFPRRRRDPRVTPHQDVAFSTRRWVWPPESLTIRRSRSSPEGDDAGEGGLPLGGSLQRGSCSPLRWHRGAGRCGDHGQLAVARLPGELCDSGSGPATPFGSARTSFGSSLGPAWTVRDPSEAGVTVRRLGRATGEPAARRPRGLYPGRALARVGAAKARRVASREATTFPVARRILPAASPRSITLWALEPHDVAETGWASFRRFAASSRPEGRLEGSVAHLTCERARSVRPCAPESTRSP